MTDQERNVLLGKAIADMKHCGKVVLTCAVMLGSVLFLGSSHPMLALVAGCLCSILGLMWVRPNQIGRILLVFGVSSLWLPVAWIYLRVTGREEIPPGLMIFFMIGVVATLWYLGKPLSKNESPQ